MSKKIRFGSILTAEEGIIVHGCNSKGVMGSGVAREIRDAHPSCYEVYHAYCKMMNFDSLVLLGQVIPYPVVGKDIVIANAVTQADFGKDHTRRYVNYGAIHTAFKTIVEIANNGKMQVHYPLIGAGLGGGNWAIISDIIDSVFAEYPDVDRTLWIYE